jgi:hypothetical protein
VQKKSQFSLCRSAVLVGNQSEHVLKKEKKARPGLKCCLFNQLKHGLPKAYLKKRI